MSKRTLFAYFEEGALGPLAEEYEDLLRNGIAERRWRGHKPYVVNQPVASPSALVRRGSPEWDLGLHLSLPSAGHAGSDTRADLEGLVALLLWLRRDTGQNFVLGIFDWAGHYAEELCYVDSDSPDLSHLWERVAGGPREK